MCPAASLWFELVLGKDDSTLLSRKLSPEEMTTGLVHVPGQGSVDFHALTVACRSSRNPAVIGHVAQAHKVLGIAPELELVLVALQGSRLRRFEVVDTLKTLHSIFGLPVICDRSANPMWPHVDLVITVVREIHVVLAMPALKKMLDVGPALDLVTQFLLLGSEELQQMRVRAPPFEVPPFPLL